MRQYELTYLISDGVPETDLNKVTGKVGGFITQFDGKLLKEEIWKRRKLAYAINKQEFATYVTVNFELPADKTNVFEREIRLSPQIIRHLLIVNDYGTEAITLTAEEVANAESIEEVIGGEKSFEAVEGETEESRDLMAVREKEDEAATDTEEKKTEVTEEPAAENKEEEKEPETVAKTAQPAKEQKAEVKAEPKKAASGRKAKASTDNEADRLAKLDEQLDELLKDDL